MDGLAKSEDEGREGFFLWKRPNRQLLDEMMRIYDGSQSSAMKGYIKKMIERDDVESTMLDAYGRNPTGSALDYADRSGTLMGVFLLYFDEGAEDDHSRTEMYADFDRANQTFINEMGIEISRDDFEKQINELDVDARVTIWSVNRSSHRGAGSGFSVN